MEYVGLRLYLLNLLIYVLYQLIFQSIINDTDDTISYYEHFLLTIKSNGPKDMVNICFIHFIF